MINLPEAARSYEKYHVFFAFSSIHIHHHFIHLCIPKFILQTPLRHTTISMRHRPIRFRMRLLIPQFPNLPFLEFLFVLLQVA